MQPTSRFLKFMGTKGQSIMEVAILFVIVVFALVSMQTYLKRGIQGAWRDGIDQIGDQYDPNTSSSDYTSRHYSNTSTVSRTAPESRVLNASSGRYVNIILTISNTTIHYDNTYTNGFETVGP